MFIAYSSRYAIAEKTLKCINSRERLGRSETAPLHGEPQRGGQAKKGSRHRLPFLTAQSVSLVKIDI
jgi:hypothetical protein